MNVTLNPYREGRREQQLVFELARELTRAYVSDVPGAAPAHVLFTQLVRIVQRFLREKVEPVRFGRWSYALVQKPEEVRRVLDRA